MLLPALLLRPAFLVERGDGRADHRNPVLVVRQDEAQDGPVEIDSQNRRHLGRTVLDGLERNGRNDGLGR